MIYEFGILSNNTILGWAYILNVERETKLTLYGHRACLNLTTGIVEYNSGTGFSIKKAQDIDMVQYRPGYRTEGFYTVRVQADSFPEAKEKAVKMYAQYLRDLSDKILSLNI